MSWRYMVPKDALSFSDLGQELRNFFLTSQKLVEVDPGVRQEVLCKLASDGGLMRIDELVSRGLKVTSPQKTSEILHNVLLPFFCTISHPCVLASAVLEKSVSTIYGYLYGPNGTRLSRLVTFLVPALTSIEQDNSIPHSKASVMRTTMVVLAKVIDLNGEALINPELPPLIRALEKPLKGLEREGGDAAAFEAFDYFNRAQRRLGLGEAIPTATGQTKKEPLRPKPSFKLPSDPPGLLSVHGRRHDNDFEDIREIKILPTTSEIESPRPEYLPTNGVASHLPALQHLVDKHFRLLREDTVGQLRDAIRAELDKPNKVDPGNRNSSATPRHQQTTRTNIYSNVKVQNFYFSRKNGFVIQICFQQPPRLKNLSSKERENWWVSSKRLQPDALVCMLDSQKTVVFCSVIGPDLPRDDTNQRRNRDKGKNLFSEKDYAYIDVKLCQLTAESIDTVVNVFASRARRPQGMQIIEFPGVLLPSFWPTLQSLQSLQSTIDLPFSEFLAPTDATLEGLMEVAPPLYAMKRGFRFNLKSIMKDSTDLYLNPTEPFDVQMLQQGSSLDDAQAIALTRAVTHRLALIQGPPGTGKSYTGVSIIKVLLDNKENAKIGPIICICYTNHALDQLLEHLVQAGIKQVIRIGSRSKSELLQPLNLRVVSKDMARTKTEGQVLFGLHKELEGDQEQAEGILAEIRADSWTIIRDFLKQHYPHHHDQLFGGKEDNGFTTVNRAKEQTIQKWLSGSGAFRGNAESSANRPLKELFTTSVFSMSTSERRRLYTNWVDRIRGRARLRLLGVLESFEATKTEMNRIHQEVDLRCLQEANVIGLTTTGLARNLDLLRRVQSHVLLCEEAGEVLEAHILTALLPSLEHAILIGDHLQLRPQVQNYKLSSESHEGKKYSLDVSLFERLIAPDTEGPRVPYTTLETQRRMHPSISQLVRDTLYPKLKDSEEADKYPEVVGMRKRLFWMDHENAEDKLASQDLVSTSHTNEFEVEMVAALVSHLVRQGVYKATDIAVLTPYLGQLHKLRQRLRRSFEIVLNDRDQDNLEEAQLGSHEETPVKEIAQTTLLQTLRAATVDNFQGEEAKVVVISLVRSNPQRKCGFLKTHNRINVLLSRAQHGMYLIGDSRTYTSIPMWDKVIAILKGDGNFGTSLDLQCPRHPESPISAAVPEDFQRFSPEGGCELMCKDRLSCGHPCINKCHSDLLHKAVKCLEPCPRPMKGCDHPCPLPCGDKCDPLCKVPLTDSNRVLPCGHGKLTLPCYQAQDLSGVRCDVKVERTIPHCGHIVTARCYQNVEDDKFRCDARCGAALPCGHTCNRACHKCFPKDNTNQSVPDHGSCTQVCNRSYATCQHSCPEPCHAGHPCQPCEAPCEVECSHSKCNKRCSEPCAPCASDNCTSSCSHGSCTMPCAAPCNWLPCSRRCEKKLDCGHRCE
ncbi:hypothetical protein FQN50_000781 [Emmonsiellopsis sp. PD_5]|nr:hypothetical protein FQN50_000781 [Emmonsiellopsis sp. PD_5]